MKGNVLLHSLEVTFTSNYSIQTWLPPANTKSTDGNH